MILHRVSLFYAFKLQLLVDLRLLDKLKTKRPLSTYAEIDPSILIQLTYHPPLQAPAS